MAKATSKAKLNGTSRPKPTKPKKRGRPTSYTRKRGAEICELVAMRVPLVRICEKPGMPSERTVYKWKQNHADFAQDYALARAHRAEARSEYIDAICEDLRNGKLDPNAARVLIDAEKWQAGKEQPAVYGDRVQIEATHSPETMKSDSEARDREQARRLVYLLDELMRRKREREEAAREARRGPKLIEAKWWRRSELARLGATVGHSTKLTRAIDPSVTRCS